MASASPPTTPPAAAALSENAAGNSGSQCSVRGWNSWRDVAFLLAAESKWPAGVSSLRAPSPWPATASLRQPHGPGLFCFSQRGAADADKCRKILLKTRFDCEMQIPELVLLRVEARKQQVTNQAARETKAAWQKRASCLEEPTLKVTRPSSPAPHTQLHFVAAGS